MVRPKPLGAVLVTRPQADAQELADRLRDLGHAPILDPLLTIRPTGTAPLDLTGVQALVFTSANGVRAAAARTPVRDMPVHAVGTATAQAARAAGFTRIATSGGDGIALAADLARTIDPRAGALLHVGGATLAVDLAALLRPHGVEVRRLVAYEAVPAAALAPATLLALDQGGITHALFFSPRTARTFASLLRLHEREAAAAGMMALCLSPAVADGVASLPWRAVRVADRRDTDALLALLPD